MNALVRIFAWVLALALVALPVVAVINGWVGAERWSLTKLRVHGQFKRVPDGVVQKTVLPYAKAGYFAVDLQSAQDAVQDLAWVETAKVRKQWPDVLEVTITEHRPFARWGSDKLLSEKGSLFAIPADLPVDDLPQLGGPDTQTTEVVELYNDSRALFAPVGLDVRSVVMDPRGSWSLLLDNGTQVLIGRDEARARLNRFVGVLPQLINQDAPIERADLRYTNGFTLSWGTPLPAAKKQTQDRT